MDAEPDEVAAFNTGEGVVTPFIGRVERPAARGGEAPARDRARAAAARLAARTGALPTVSEVETEAGVSRGTAASVLKALRADEPALHELRAAAPRGTGPTSGDLTGPAKDPQP